MENYFSSLTITLVILEISNKQLIESFATIPTPTNHEDVTHPTYRAKKSHLRVLMMRGVSDATHIPVQKPKPDARVKKLQYCEHLVMVMTTEKSNKNTFLNTFTYYE